MADISHPPVRDFRLRSLRVLAVGGERPATIDVRNGKIAEIGAYELGDDKVVPTIEYGTTAILPGAVDVHVHFNQPGRADWEGFATGSAAAAAGGTTLVVDMPLNSSPVTTSVAALTAKRSAATGLLFCDVGFYGGLVPENADDIPALIDAGVLGIKAFLCPSGIDDFPASTEQELRAVMPLLAQRSIPLLAHAELVSAEYHLADKQNYADFLASRPPEFERDAISMLIGLCRETGCRTHIVHLSDAESLPMLKAARAEGLPITVETCSHYLTFDAESIPRGATEFKCTPPIRSRANRELLWSGLVNGNIDFITTDHSPSPPQLKFLDDGDFERAWGGISSVQLFLAAVWTEAAARGHSLANVVEWVSHRPGGFIGRDVRLRPGVDATLVAFDADEKFVVDSGRLFHRHPLTPYEGRTMQGVVKQTWIRGVPVARNVGMTL